MTLPQLSRKQYADRITQAWNKALEGVLEAGYQLVEAKTKLKHGEFGVMIAEDLPFGSGTAQRLMRIAGDPRLSNTAHGPLLPPSWRTLYEITKLSDAQFDEAVTHHIIRPDMERRDLKHYFKGQQRAKKLADLSERIEAARKQLGGLQYGVIYADPPWRFEPYSRETGMTTTFPDNHYPTMTAEEIASLPVAEACFEDCVLWLWATVPMLPQAKDTLDAWGFTYKSHMIWMKDRPGTGYWLRNQHELLLIGTRGQIPAPAPGDQPTSVLEAAVGAHSVKPEIFRQVIEDMYPADPHKPWHLEMFSRTKAPGWDAWGAEALP